MALKYRMIVSDFDGTLGRSEGGISEGNIRAIQQYTENGGVEVEAPAGVIQYKIVEITK